MPLGPVTHATHAQFVGYYDGHNDWYFATDTSSKARAKAMHINYSAAIRGAKGAPRQFFIEGKRAKGQLSVFGRARATTTRETDIHVVLNAPISKSASPSSLLHEMEKPRASGASR